MQNKNSHTRDAYLACLLGGAIGDALGAPIEFDSLRTIQTRYGHDGIKDYVEFSDGHGEFTDDTQMALFTAEGLLRAHYRASQRGTWGAVYKISHESLLRWLHTQKNKAYTPIDGEHPINNNWLIQQNELYVRRAPGNTCLAALESGVAGTMNQAINNSKGCGTIMRMAPVGLIDPRNTESNFDLGCELSAITHGHPNGFLSGGFFAAVISELVKGQELNRAINTSIKILKKYRHHEETLRAVEAALNLYTNTRQQGYTPQAEDLQQLGEGWVAEEALSMSLFAALHYENDYQKGVLYAVNHSGDSDSTGSITGNILGLINGLEAIPKSWVNKLRAANLVMEAAEDLYHHSKMSAPNDIDYHWQCKYIN